MSFFRRLLGAPRGFLFAAVFLVLLMPGALAQRGGGAQDSGQEATPSQTQATMASLFGRGAKMPGIPKIDGTLALPSFDSRELTVDESVVKKPEDFSVAQTRNGQRNH